MPEEVKALEAENTLTRPRMKKEEERRLRGKGEGGEILSLTSRSKEEKMEQ